MDATGVYALEHTSPERANLYAFRNAPIDATVDGGLEAPALVAADGWHTISTDASVLEPEGFPITWASTIPFTDEDLESFAVNGVLVTSGWPLATMRELGPEEHRDPRKPPAPRRRPGLEGAAAPERHLPLRLEDARILPEWEGQAAANVPEYRIAGMVGDRYLEVRIFFGTQEPSEETLRRAQEQLDRLEMPPGS